MRTSVVDGAVRGAVMLLAAVGLLAVFPHDVGTPMVHGLALAMASLGWLFFVLKLALGRHAWRAWRAGRLGVLLGAGATTFAFVAAVLAVSQEAHSAALVLFACSSLAMLVTGAGVAWLQPSPADAAGVSDAEAPAATDIPERTEGLPA